ncbi:TPA: hypothetical protein DEP96_04235 [Candidatus Uhrbacteria bacterium]|nr:hypothetical protein [Candidatus Uhrbacteria bacterium]
MSTRTSLSVLLQQRGVNLNAEDFPIIGLSNRLNIAAWVFWQLQHGTDLSRLYCLELELDEKDPVLKQCPTLGEEIRLAMKGSDDHRIREHLVDIARRVNDRPALPYFRHIMLDGKDDGRDYICWVRNTGADRDQAGNRARNQELPLVCLRLPRDRTKATRLEGSLNGKMTGLDTRSGGEMNYVFTWEDISWFRIGGDVHSGRTEQQKLLEIWRRMIPAEYSVPLHWFRKMVFDTQIVPYCPPLE